MLLRLFGLIVLSVLCWTNQDSQFYNEEEQESEGPSEGLRRMQRSLAFNNLSSLPVGLMGAADTPVMFPDTSICDVLLNSQEPVAIDQIPFFCLCSHCKATTGPKGERGDRGLQGFTGSPGRRGFMGFRGRRGFTGAQGAKGQNGDQGDKGQPGHIGFQGIKGQLGVKGEKGDDGDDGPSGPLGPQGVAGSCLCEPVIGPPGYSGPSGPAGARGLPGIPGSKGPAGDKGDKGDLGVNGRDGAEGLKGAQGEPGPCDCTDGVDGADGQKGDKGDTGGKGDTGPKGDQGEVGAPGPIGDPGFPGRPGPCTLAVQSAFSVGLETPFPAPEKPVRFTKVLYNVQGHYNQALGIFIAPVNGTYVFSFHLAVRDRVLIAALFHNFHPVIKITETTNFATASRSIVLHLTGNDILWVQVKDQVHNGMYADELISSTFTGFLLSPDECYFSLDRSFTGNTTTLPVDKPFSWT